MECLARKLRVTGRPSCGGESGRSGIGRGILFVEREVGGVRGTERERADGELECGDERGRERERGMEVEGADGAEGSGGGRFSEESKGSGGIDEGVSFQGRMWEVWMVVCMRSLGATAIS